MLHPVGKRTSLALRNVPWRRLYLFTFRRYLSTDITEAESVVPGRQDYEISVENMENVEGEERKIDNIRLKYLGPGDNGFGRIKVSLKDYLKGNDHETHKAFNGVSKYKQGLKVEQRIFMDLRLIRVKSGKGGNGCVSFSRGPHMPVGPPDGGDGGGGGGVCIQAVEGLTSLHRIKRSYEAKSGESGKKSQLDGKNGQDVIIEVPVGTTIKWVPDPFLVRRFLKQVKQNTSKLVLNLNTTGEDNEKIQFFRQKMEPGEDWIFKEREEEYFYGRDFFNELNARVKEYDLETTYDEYYDDTFPIQGMDLVEPSENPILLVKGGRGGMGNMHFLTKDIRNPRFAKRGRDGITNYFLLELKLLADIGLVGFPNAGKSTLLRSISKAKPRVGHWEFTTLQPTVGTISTAIYNDPFTVADIPGIIKGASQNKGMGLDFLRHIERSGGLAFVVSLESDNPVDDLKILINEVGNKRMENKKVLVVASKADLVDTPDKFTSLKDYCSTLGWKIVPVCATQKENMEHCIDLMYETAKQPVE